MPADLARVKRRKQLWWRALLGAVATVALVMLVLNPELAALSFLFDPIVLDVAILFFGTQILLFNDQIQVFLTATCSSVARCWKALRLRR